MGAPISPVVMLYISLLSSHFSFRLSLSFCYSHISRPLSISFPFPTPHLYSLSCSPLSWMSPISLVSATSPVASWCACWCLKTRVIQVEQEAIVSRIWALGTEAGHRSHEGANAYSALVDWFWLCPSPHSTLPNTTASMLYLLFSPPIRFIHDYFFHTFHVLSSKHLLNSGTICWVAEWES